MRVGEGKSRGEARSASGICAACHPPFLFPLLLCEFSDNSIAVLCPLYCPVTWQTTCRRQYNSRRFFRRFFSVERPPYFPLPWPVRRTQDRLSDVRLPNACGTFFMKRTTSIHILERFRKNRLLCRPYVNTTYIGATCHSDKNDMRL